MHATWSGLLVLQQPPQQRRSSTTLPPSTVVHADSVRTLTYQPDELSHTRTRRSGSTVWGPGALTGKVLKKFGEQVEKGAEYVVIRTKLNQIAKMQSSLLRSPSFPPVDDQITDQCAKLVDLCIIGMGYPSALMKRAFCLILGGFKRPGRQVWSHYIAEAISKRQTVDVFELFEEGFFALLDDSIFRIDGLVDLETLSFRCPAVSHQIAAIISRLARKDRTLASSPSLSLTLNTAVEYDTTSFSSAIIKGGFFRLARHWVDHGLPHWDQRGRECLEEALKDVADAQRFHGDLQSVEDAQELLVKLRGQRFLSLDDILEAHEHTRNTDNPSI